MKVLLCAGASVRMGIGQYGIVSSVTNHAIRIISRTSAVHTELNVPRFSLVKSLGGDGDAESPQLKVFMNRRYFTLAECCIINGILPHNISEIHPTHPEPEFQSGNQIVYVDDINHAELIGICGYEIRSSPPPTPLSPLSHEEKEQEPQPQPPAHQEKGQEEQQKQQQEEKKQKVESESIVPQDLISTQKESDGKQYELDVDQDLLHYIDSEIQSPDFNSGSFGPSFELPFCSNNTSQAPGRSDSQLNWVTTLFPDASDQDTGNHSPLPHQSPTNLNFCESPPRTSTTYTNNNNNNNNSINNINSSSNNNNNNNNYYYSSPATITNSYTPIYQHQQSPAIVHSCVTAVQAPVHPSNPVLASVVSVPVPPTAIPAIALVPNASSSFQSSSSLVIRARHSDRKSIPNATCPYALRDRVQSLCSKLKANRIQLNELEEDSIHTARKAIEAILAQNNW